ncbi:hypothetical protein LX16_3159 [Stackebrandtia albiflava]|uniref:Uncharacterized protein n=1 Tax=Stackebrandtia albiflava TaxID=406432 RepID=A0A562V3K2_9ACTN|nr:hypothetical protein [Stackebrandtia albiflava]TWJ12402.1 hypothetical protein LX16_3159 [Stackebrandtia albiflava]
MEADTTGILTASRLLSHLGGGYGDAAARVEDLTGDTTRMFESTAVGGAWADVVHIIRDYLADSRDSCHDTGNTLAHYVTSVHLADDAGADVLRHAGRQTDEEAPVPGTDAVADEDAPAAGTGETSEPDDPTARED